MAIEHHFYMDISASRQVLRDTLAQAGIGLVADDDFKDTSGAYSEATYVTLIDHDLSKRAGRPDNGVLPTRRLTFRDTRVYQDKPEFEGVFELETARGILALLKAFPDADAYWEAYDARRPVLLRRSGRLVLSLAKTTGGEIWDEERQPYRALVDLPYTIEPLGPWKYIPRQEAALSRHDEAEQSMEAARNL